MASLLQDFYGNDPDFCRFSGDAGKVLLLGPDGSKLCFVPDQIGKGESVQMAQKGFDPVGKNMAQAADRRDNAAIAPDIETFDKAAELLEPADHLADIDGVGGLVEHQPAAAPADTLDKALRSQPLGDLHQMVFRYAILPGYFGDRMLAVMGGQIHQGAQRIVGLDG
tara:strand:- start:45536 stop:46036 length:501 start_codon:yes stop_codon:yes gene_type:complete